MFYRYHVRTTLTKNEISKKVKKLIQLSNDHKNIVLKFINEVKSPKVFSYPDFSRSFVVHCNGNEKGLGAVLNQKIDGVIKVISYPSRTLTQAKKKLSYT